MKALFVDKLNPKILEVSPNPKLNEFEKIIDGSIEIVTLRFYERDKSLKDLILIIDDGGKFKPKPLNFVIGTRTPIYGPVIFSKTDRNGDLVDLTDKDVESIYKYLGVDEQITLNERI